MGSQSTALVLSLAPQEYVNRNCPALGLWSTSTWTGGGGRILRYYVKQVQHCLLVLLLLSASRSHVLHHIF